MLSQLSALIVANLNGANNPIRLQFQVQSTVPQVAQPPVAYPPVMGSIPQGFYPPQQFFPTHAQQPAFTPGQAFFPQQYDDPGTAKPVPPVRGDVLCFKCKSYRHYANACPGNGNKPN